MNPESPQEVPQEFLTVQVFSVDPTKRTPWLTFLAQLVKTPDLQGDQLVASTATEMGLALSALSKLVHPSTSTQSVIVQSPPAIAQAWSLALQGQAEVSVSPLSMTKSKAESIHPPLHPWFPYFREQSTSCCSDKLGLLPLLSKKALSMEAVAEKAQHDPHCPWFLTGVTFPQAVQSTSPLRLEVISLIFETFCSAGAWRVRQRETNSA